MDRWSRCATIPTVGRPQAVTGRREQQLERLLAVGVSQQVAADALGVSRRTVCRWVAARRRAAEPKPIDELISEAIAPAAWPLNGRPGESDWLRY
jgi:Homeodomain-like domain